MGRRGLPPQKLVKVIVISMMIIAIFYLSTIVVIFVMIMIIVKFNEVSIYYQIAGALNMKIDNMEIG